MGKIFVNRADSAKEVIAKALEADGDKVVLVIPKNAVFSSSAGNFKTLMAELDKADKKVGIESVDEKTLDLAERVGMEATHPLFRKGARLMSDIVPIRAASASAYDFKLEKKNEDNNQPGEETKNFIKIAVQEEAEKKTKKTSKKEQSDANEEILFSPPIKTSEPENIYDQIVSEEDGRRAKKRRRKVALYAFLAIGCVIGGGWFYGMAFGRAEVALNIKKSAWEYTGSISVKKTAAEISAGEKIIPGELFTEKRNITTLFPASGRSQVKEKAAGTIVIYNAYSSQSQQLVAKTRFETPDGKIFRLVEGVTVPAATVSGGKIQPSNTTAKIEADQPGEAYNVGPVEKMTIPGFKGTSKYDGFYGSITTPLSGGYVGEKAVPTESDISVAREKTKEMLESSLESGIMKNNPSDFKFVKGASEFKITKLAVVSSTDQNGKFAVFGEGEFKAIGFRGRDLENMFLKLAEAADGQVLQGLTVSYADPLVNFEAGSFAVNVEANAVLTGDFNEQKLKDSIRGKKIDEARREVAKVPFLASGKITVKPMWLYKIPSKINRVSVVLE